MGHQRYVLKNGKTYGPYLYESYRDSSGNVKKRYMGKGSDAKRGEILSKSFIFLLISLMIFSFSMIFRLLFKDFF